MIVLRRTVLFADHAQFYLSGEAAARRAGEFGDRPEPWTGDAVDVYRIGLDGPHTLAVGAARSDHVAVVLRLAPHELDRLTTTTDARRRAHAGGPVPENG